MANSRKQRPAELEAGVRQALRRHAPPGSRLCVGLSGGLDSVALLFILNRLAADIPFRLSAVHVNHQLHPEADRWQQFAQACCREWRIPLACERVRVDRRDPEGLEAAARRARYAVFSRQDADFIVLAHQQDDQAETLFTQLLRGAGLPGLSAMPASRRLDPHRASPVLLRPLLQVTRADLAAYAQAQQLQWVDDPSNDDPVHVRNFLRHAVGPVLDGRFPSWRATFARAARHLSEAETLLDQMARQDFDACGDAQGIRVDEALALGTARAGNLLRGWLRGQGAPACNSDQLAEWLRQSAARGDRVPELVWGGWTLSRFGGRWQVHRTVARDWQALALKDWPDQPVVIPRAGRLFHTPTVGQGLRASVLRQGGIELRRRGGGERLRPHAGGPSRTLRNLLQEARLPPWYRDALPLVFQGETLICVPGVAVDAAFQAQPGEPGLELLWQPPDGCSAQSGC